MTRPALVFLLALAACPLPSQLQGQALCSQIKALTLDPTVSAAHWGVAVTTLDGTMLCGINEAQLFRPASNNKIFTTAAALALLGPDKTFTTRVMADGVLADGVLQGNLRLVGGGDANFGAEDLPYVSPAERPSNSASPAPRSPLIADIEAFADQIAARGIRSVQGDVLGDDRYFAWEPYPPDWSLDDLVYGYGAPVSALTIHDNEIEMQVTPAKHGAKAAIAAIPDVPYYALDASVYTVDFGKNCDERLSFQRAPGSRKLVIFGDIGEQTKPCSQNVAIADPAEYAALALKLALERRGITVSGAALAKHYEARILGNVFAQRPDDDSFLRGAIARMHPRVSCAAQSLAGRDSAFATDQKLEVAAHLSLPLLADITYTNKVSQNLHAEVLLRDLGVAFACEGASQRDGLHVVRQYALQAGVDPKDFVLYDGSGLSGHDLVAPRAFAKFLSFAAAQPWFERWKATLPEAGIDGSLAARLAGPALKGRVFAKTGTLGESRALSGYVTTTSGKMLVFSVMVDNHLPGNADRAVMDKIVERIAQEK